MFQDVVSHHMTKTHPFRMVPPLRDRVIWRHTRRIIWLRPHPKKLVVLFEHGKMMIYPPVDEQFMLLNITIFT